MPASWRLSKDLKQGLAGTRVRGPTASPLERDNDEDSPGGYWFDSRSGLPRSTWYTQERPPDENRDSYWYFEPGRLSSARRVLELVLIILEDGKDKGCGWRWRLATRVVEVAYPLIVRRTSETIDEEEHRLLPLLQWVRWRLLSEPFRAKRGGECISFVVAARPGVECDTEDLSLAGKGAFGSCEKLKQRAADSRVTWAETLLTYQDHPALARLDVDAEGKLLVFCGEDDSQLLDIDDKRLASNRPSVDDAFVTWFSREFFSRRFMLKEMWQAVRSPTKWVTAIVSVMTVVLALLVGLTVSPVMPLGLSDESSMWGWSAVLVAYFGVFLVLATATLIGSLLGKGGSESFAYPLLFRFGAGTVFGSAAVITMRAGWMKNLARPDSGHEWRGWVILLSLAVVGFTYLLVEARLHGTSGRATFVRVLGVWLVGLGWALIIGAIDVLVIAPVFTEDFFVFSSAEGRLWAFFVTALASLDLGIFLQVLWEDKPVTYPLGALRLSRHG